MKKILCLFIGFTTLANCQDKNTITATLDNTLQVANGSRLNGGTPCKYNEQPTYIINDDFVVYQDCKTHKVIYPDLKTFRRPKDYDKGFALVKDGVYVRGEFVKTDTTGFAFVGMNNKQEILWKTSQMVYKDLNPVPGLDAPTFKRMPGHFLGFYAEENEYYSDKNHIYYFDKVIEGSDGASANNSYDEFFHDKNYIYKDGKIARYKNEPYQNVNSSLYKTKNQVFCQEQIIPNIDAATLVGLSRGYSKDKNHIYYQKDITPIKPEDFSKVRVWDQVNSAYVSDGKNIYVNDKYRIDLDVASFGVIPKCDEVYDKNGVYLRNGYDEKTNKILFKKIPFDYSEPVSPNNTYMSKSYLYIIYGNQAYNRSDKKILKNLTPEQLVTARTGRLDLSNLEGSNMQRIVFDYQFFQLGEHIYFKDKKTNIDPTNFRWINYGCYANNEAVYTYTRMEIRKIEGADPNTVKAVNEYFIKDKNYLYYNGARLIKSDKFALLAIFPGYRQGCGEDPTPASNFYLFQNAEGYWLFKFSNDVSYRFLGKTFNPAWDSAFAGITLPKA